MGWDADTKAEWAKIYARLFELGDEFKSLDESLASDITRTADLRPGRVERAGIAAIVVGVAARAGMPPALVAPFVDFILADDKSDPASRPHDGAIDNPKVM